MEQDNILSVANDFLVLYYQRMAFNRREVIKFYSPNAYVYRQEFEEKYGKEIEQCAQEHFVPRIPHATQLNIVDYSVLPIENGFNLIVQGNIVYPEGDVFTLNQYFTIMNEEGKFFIVADSLYINSTTEEIFLEGLEEVPQKSQRRGRPSRNSQEGEKKEEPVKQPEINPKKVQQKREQPRKEQQRKNENRFKEYIPGN